MLYRAACQQTTQYPVVFAGDREHVRIHRGRILSKPSQYTLACVSVAYFGGLPVSPKPDNCTCTADDRYPALFWGGLYSLRGINSNKSVKNRYYKHVKLNTFFSQQRSHLTCFPVCPDGPPTCCLLLVVTSCMPADTHPGTLPKVHTLCFTCLQCRDIVVHNVFFHHSPGREPGSIALDRFLHHMDPAMRRPVLRN